MFTFASNQLKRKDNKIQYIFAQMSVSIFKKKAESIQSVLCVENVEEIDLKVEIIWNK